MRSRLLLLTTLTLTAAACADGGLFEPTNRPGIRPNANFAYCADNAPPVTSLTVSPADSVAAGAPITVRVEGSAPLGDWAPTLTWNYPEPHQAMTLAGNAAVATGAYAEPGTYYLEVRVGCFFEFRTITVTEAAPADSTGTPVDSTGGTPGDSAGVPGDSTVTPGDSTVTPGDSTATPGDSGEGPEIEEPVDQGTGGSTPPPVEYSTAGTYTVSPEPVPVGTSVPLTATFDGTTTTATISWGDDIVQTVPVTNGQVSATHEYAEPGLYSITVTSGGVTATVAGGSYVPVYNPSGGFVTGGGWIDSRAGAYKAGTTLAGKATFGLVAKTKRGVVIPDGNVEFQFHPAKLNFKSRGLEWLLVSDRTATIQGHGTINGAGDYGFVLTTRDGDREDTFRMRIYDRVSGHTVYDSDFDKAETALPTARLTSGNVVVHTK